MGALRNIFLELGSITFMWTNPDLVDQHFVFSEVFTATKNDTGQLSGTYLCVYKSVHQVNPLQWIFYGKCTSLKDICVQNLDS